MASNNAAPNQTAMMLTDGPNSGTGGVTGAKGRLIFETNGSGISNPHQIVTLYDSKPQKTNATTGYRPLGDPEDIFFGTNSAGDLSIGGGTKGIAQYIHNLGVDNAWLERLTASLKSFKVPIVAPEVNSLNGFQVNGSYGSRGECLVSTGTGSAWGACATSDPAPPGKSESSQNSMRRIFGTTDFSTPLPNGACTDASFPSDVTDADLLVAAWPANLNPGLIGNMFVSAPERVTVRLCNFSGTSLTPGLLRLNATVARTGISSSNTLDFSQIPNGRCQNRIMTLKGAFMGDPVLPKWPDTLEPGLIGTMSVSGENTVEVRLCNFSGKTVTLNGQLFGAYIAR